MLAISDKIPEGWDQSAPSLDVKLGVLRNPGMIERRMVGDKVHDELEAFVFQTILSVLEGLL